MNARTDISGYRIFSRGQLGEAHTLAHRMLDGHRHRQGHRALSAWLRGRHGQGSEWVHLQWHMLVFDLAVGAWDDAHQRFRDHILPVARAGREAATDAPAALWRLSLAAPGPVSLPWSAVRAGALARMDQRRDPYVKLHDVLALAGAGDVESVDRWLAMHEHEQPVLLELATALRAYAAGAYGRAAAGFASALPDVATVGGSHAQNQLLFDIHRTALVKSASGDIDSARQPVRTARAA